MYKHNYCISCNHHSVAKDGSKNVVCATVPEAELQIVSLLQEKFLELLARFR